MMIPIRCSRVVSKYIRFGRVLILGGAVGIGAPSLAHASDALASAFDRLAQLEVQAKLVTDPTEQAIMTQQAAILALVLGQTSTAERLVKSKSTAEQAFLADLLDENKAHVPQVPHIDPISRDRISHWFRDGSICRLQALDPSLCGPLR